MKPEKILIHNEPESIETILDMVTDTAHKNHMSEKETLRLRLLAEEMFGISRVLIGETDSYFWIIEDNPSFEFHLSVNTDMDERKKESLLQVATSGENEATRGIGGKIREILSAAIRGIGMTSVVPDEYDGVEVDYPRFGQDGQNADAWSLHEYKSKIRQERAQMAQAWDELEKSIIANLADDVRISIKGNDVEMIVYKCF